MKQLHKRTKSSFFGYALTFELLEDCCQTGKWCCSPHWFLLIMLQWQQLKTLSTISFLKINNVISLKCITMLNAVKEFLWTHTCSSQKKQIVASILLGRRSFGREILSLSFKIWKSRNCSLESMVLVVILLPLVSLPHPCTSFLWLWEWSDRLINTSVLLFLCFVHQRLHSLSNSGGHLDVFGACTRSWLVTQSQLGPS